MLPPLVLQERFDGLVVPMGQMTVTLNAKNANLRATQADIRGGDVSSFPKPEVTHEHE